MYTLGQLLTFGLVAFVVGVALDTFVKRLYAGRLERAVLAEREIARAVVWLANYNYGLYVAVQEVLMKQSTIGYYQLGKMIRLELAEPCGRLNQLIPLEVVPPSLLDAATAYNARVASGWAPAYAQHCASDGPFAARIRQLEDALAAMRWADVGFLYDYYGMADVAKQAGTSYLQVESVVRVLAANAHQHVNHILGLSDPEEALPSIY